MPPGGPEATRPHAQRRPDPLPRNARIAQPRRPVERGACAWRTRAQPPERGRRHSAQCAGGVQRCLGLGQVVARVRDDLRRGAAALLRIGGALRTSAHRSGRCARGRLHRRPATCGRTATTARHAECALVGGQCHHAVEPDSHAVFARRPLPRRSAHAVCGGLFTEHPAGGLPRLPRSGPRLRSDRSVDGAGRFAQHPRARHRRVAARLARAEPARHPGHAGLRRRPALARAAEEGPRLDSLHRGAAHRARLCGPDAGADARGAAPQARAQLPGHLHRRAPVRAPHPCDHAERADEAARGALHGRQPLPRLPRQAAQAGSAVRHLCRTRHRCARAAAAGPTGRGADAGG